MKQEERYIDKIILQKDKMMERLKDEKIKDKTTIVFVQIYFQGPVI